MAKEVLLYGDVTEDMAKDFVKEVIAISSQGESESLLVRINTNGGSPTDMQAMIGKLSEYEGNIDAIVDGKAYSAGSFMLPYIKGKRIAYDTSQFLLHRAAYSSWFEKSEYMTAAMWENLNNINKDGRKALEAVIDVEKLEKIKGVTLDQIFDNDNRVDVFLTAKEAKQIGLITEVRKITPEAYNDIVGKMAAKMLPGFHITQDNEQKACSGNQNQSIKMTLDELKSKHPDVYAQAISAGVSQERDRVGAWMAFVDVDSECVAKGIKEGGVLSQTMTAELARKAFSKEALEGLKNEAPETPSTQASNEPEKDTKEAEIEAFLEASRKLRATKTEK